MANKIYADRLSYLCPEIVIGNKGDTCNTEVYFPTIEGLTGTVYVKRCGDTKESAVATSVEDGYIVWTISAYDVENIGWGYCEVVYTLGDTVEKSITYNTIVHSSGYSPICWQCV